MGWANGLGLLPTLPEQTLTLYWLYIAFQNTKEFNVFKLNNKLYNPGAAFTNMD